MRLVMASSRDLELSATFKEITQRPKTCYETQGKKYRSAFGFGCGRAHEMSAIVHDWMKFRSHLSWRLAKLIRLTYSWQTFWGPFSIFCPGFTGRAFELLRCLLFYLSGRCRRNKTTNALSPGGGVLPYMCYIGICRPKGWSDLVF